MLLKFDADNVISASSEFECCQYEWGFDKIVNKKTEIEKRLKDDQLLATQKWFSCDVRFRKAKKNV